MTAVRYDDDAELSVIQSRRVAVIGYGSQGQAHALSLRDSGADVRVGLPAGSAAVTVAADEGLPVHTPAAAAAAADLIMILAPDAVHRELYVTDIAPNLDDGDALFFAHGFNIRYGLIEPPSTVDVALVAPKAPGPLLRRQFVDGKGVPCLVAVHADATGNAWPLALSYAKAIGGTRAGVIATTFADETEAALFGGQALLRGGVPALVRAGFEVLTEAGYPAELAYFECLHGLKAIVDRMSERGLAGLHSQAPYGARIVSPAVKEELRKILAEITGGTFAAESATEPAADEDQQPIERAGHAMRGLMSWLHRA